MTSATGEFRKLVETADALPIRQRTAHVPRPATTIERTCSRCGASFLGLAPGKTGERGIWTNWHWFCSQQCYDEACGIWRLGGER